MSKIDERLEKIKRDHETLLKKVRESILENNESFNQEIGQVITVLDLEEKSKKKYEAMIKAQELISSLTQEIVEAKTVDEVLNIRKKLNYYINKIKEELIKREVEQKTILEYKEKSMELRKDIAKYIRFLKRENNIVTIENMCADFDNLTKEEKEVLRKKLKREINYNTRNLNSSQKNDTKNEKIESSAEDEKESCNLLSSLFAKAQKANERAETLGGLSALFPTIAKKEEKNNFLDSSLDLLPKTHIDEEKTLEVITLGKHIENNMEQSGNQDIDTLPPIYLGRHERNPQKDEKDKSIEEMDFEEAYEFLEERIKGFREQYHLAVTHDYDRKNFLGNIINFFRNISPYLYNKKAIKKMERDYFYFYRGGDFQSFIEYTRRRNSIKEGLRCLFSRSYLYSEESRYLNINENCSRWLFDFCKENSMDLPVTRKYQF